MAKKVKYDDLDEALRVSYGVATLEVWASQVGVTLGELTAHVDECRNRDAVIGANKQTPQRSLMYSRKIAADMLAFLAEYQECCMMTRAASAIKVSPKTIRYWRSVFPIFNDLCGEMQESMVDIAEDELYRRAVVGEETNVYHMGQVVDKVQKKSDDLLKFLLNANRHKFRAKSEVNMTGASGGPIQVEEVVNIDTLREKLFERLLGKVIEKGRDNV